MGDQNYDDATRRGFAAFDRGDFQSSLTAFEDAFRFATDDAERAAAQLQIAYRLDSLGRHESSNEAATNALDGFRSVADREQATLDEIYMAKMNIGWCHGVLGEREAALAAFRECLSLARPPTQMAEIHCHVGYQLEGLARIGEAREHFRQAAEMEGADVAARTPACMKMGSTADALGDWTEKLKWYRFALELGGMSRENEAECWWALAGAHYVLGAYHDAKHAIDEMLAIPEANPDFVRDARTMLEAIAQPHEPAASSDRREVICGMNGEIHWQAVLPPSGLDGLEVDGNWEREGDTLTVRSKDGMAALLFGEDSWQDYELEVHVTPLEGGNAQAVVRQSFLGAYVVDLMLGWQAAQIARTRSHSHERLSVVDFPLIHGHEYHLQVAARGASITTYIDGKLVNQTTDFDMKQGKLGLLAWHSVTRFRAPRYRVL